MKKNRMMRLASLLLVCVLLTTSVISGTFAKYVTTASASDTARVAKWGIELAVTGEGVFAEEYDDTVKTSVAGEKLVAPGTKNDTGISFKITGKPEVAFKLTATLGAADKCKDVFLKTGEYPDYTTANDTTDKFTLDKDYYPVVFTLTHTYSDDAFSIAGAVTGTGATCDTSVTGKDVITGTMAQINAVLANVSNAMSQVNPNYPLNDEFKLTWKWDFEQSNSNLYNKADTLLGNLIAGTATGVDASKYSLNVAYEFSITAEQVD